MSFKQEAEVNSLLKLTSSFDRLKGHIKAIIRESGGNLRIHYLAARLRLEVLALQHTLCLILINKLRNILLGELPGDQVDESFSTSQHDMEVLLHLGVAYEMIQELKSAVQCGSVHSHGRNAGDEPDMERDEPDMEQDKPDMEQDEPDMELD